MSGQTERVLFAKYNSTRKPEYRITTELCENEDGVYIQKRAGEAAALAHLENISKNVSWLKDYYRDIKVISCEQGEGKLYFPFLKGQTLAELIDARDGDKEHFIAQVNEKLDQVFHIQEQHYVPFETSEGFEAVFGKPEFEDVPSLNPVNVDALLANFVETEEGIFCIDCEWVFHFPVPVEFIRYRILRYLYLNQVQPLLKGVSLEEMLGWFGITAQTNRLYWEMEMRFQQYVHGENWKYIYTEHYKKKNLSIEDIDREIQGLKADSAFKDGVIHDKDVHIENLGGIIDYLRQQIAIRDDSVRRQDEHIQYQRAQLESQKTQIEEKNALIERQNTQIMNQNMQIQRLTVDLQTIASSFFWRVTGPARKALDGFKHVVKRNAFTYRFFKMMKETLRYGPRHVIKNHKNYVVERERVRALVGWPSEKEIAKKKKVTFSKTVKFSVLVPLYNTPDSFLREMIQSVQNQTYKNWELCLADGSDDAHVSVGETCRELAGKDNRIKYRKLEKNLGISGNTNACIEMATGDYIALFDHDDVLNPFALQENMRVICEQDADFIYSDETTFSTRPTEAYGHHFKPDFAPDTLRSYNYICHLTVFKRTLLDEIGGGFRSAFDGSQDYDMVLRLSEKAKRIVHIPKILYYWRAHSGSVASGVGAKPYTVDAGKRALAEHLKRVGLKGTVMDSSFPSTYRVQYEIKGQPMISIVIPNMDHVDDLRACIDSITAKSTWKNWEIVVVENNSKNPETFAYYDSIKGRPEIQIVTWDGGFNFSAICNHGAKAAKGDYILLLNNDMQVITPDWLEQMLMFAQRSDVGAVGAMLYYPDDTIQHAGVIIGIGGVAGHSHKCYPRGHQGYFCRLSLAQDLSAVTGACCMVPRRVWEQIGGLDEGFAVAFNDVDLCMRIREAGYLIVWTPYAELYHYESKSRGYENTPEKVKRFEGETARFHQRWDDFLAKGDPYYNPNLTLVKEDFSFR